MTPLSNYSEIIKTDKSLRDIILQYIEEETSEGREIQGVKDGRITK